MKKVIYMFKRGDYSILKLIHHKMSCTTFDKVMPYLTCLGGLVFSVLVPFILMIIDNKGSKLLGMEITVALILSTFVVQILKTIFARERPFNIFEDMRNFEYDLKDYSFPSGHTTASFTIVTMVILNLPELRLLFLIAIIIGLSRIYLGVHFPTDVVIGGIIGFYMAIFTHAVIWPLLVLKFLN